MACLLLVRAYYMPSLVSYVPDLQLVRIESSVNSSQQRGSLSTILLCVHG